VIRAGLRSRASFAIALSCVLAACSVGEDADGASAAGESAAAGDTPGQGHTEERRRPLPSFRLATLAGGEVGSEDLHGKIVVIDFWATWCLPCEETVPELNAFYDAHRADGVEVLGISIDEDTESVVGEWIAKHAVRYPILLGDVGLAQRFAAPGFPATYFVAPDGTMSDPHVGYLDRADLEESLARVRSYADAVRRVQAQAAPRTGRFPGS